VFPYFSPPNAHPCLFEPFYAGYIPASGYLAAVDRDMSNPPAPVYGKDLIMLVTKIGYRFTPVKHFSVDLWYERSDLCADGEWTLHKGLASVTFGISL
jgi:hypothetical protein